MGNVNLYRYGEKNPVQIACALAKVTYIGNVVGASGGTLVNASDTTWDTNIATTQEAFHDIMLGVSEQASPATDSKDVRVATEAVFEYTCESASFAVGDLVGMAKAAGNALEDQKVVAVATANLAIGRVAKATASATTVLVRIVSTIMLGGPQAMA